MIDVFDNVLEDHYALLIDDQVRKIEIFGKMSSSKMIKICRFFGIGENG